MVFLNALLLFIAKVIDNMLGTAKTLFVQRSMSLLAGISIGLSNYIYLTITKNVVTSDSQAALIIVSIASGVGCCLAVSLSNKLSKEKTYVNVIMSDNMGEMMKLRDFLAKNHITNLVTDSYALDWRSKTMAITAYAETKEQSLLIDEYLAGNDNKFKRVVNNSVIRRKKVGGEIK